MEHGGDSWVVQSGVSTACGLLFPQGPAGCSPWVDTALGTAGAAPTRVGQKLRSPGQAASQHLVFIGKPHILWKIEGLPSFNSIASLAAVWVRDGGGVWPSREQEGGPCGEGTHRPGCSLSAKRAQGASPVRKDSAQAGSPGHSVLASRKMRALQETQCRVRRTPSVLCVKLHVKIKRFFESELLQQFTQLPLLA